MLKKKIKDYLAVNIYSYHGQQLKLLQIKSFQRQKNFLLFQRIVCFYKRELQVQYFIVQNDKYSNKCIFIVDSSCEYKYSFRLLSVGI